MHSLQAGRWGWRWATSERECCGRSYLWLCLSASEVEELQNPLLIAKPAGFRCLARYLVPSGRSRVSRGLTHRLRDDLGGRRSFKNVDRLMGFIKGSFACLRTACRSCSLLSRPEPLSPPCLWLCGFSRASIGLCVDAPCVITPSNVDTKSRGYAARTHRAKREKPTKGSSMRGDDERQSGASRSVSRRRIRAAGRRGPASQHHHSRAPRRGETQSSGLLPTTPP